MVHREPVVTGRGGDKTRPFLGRRKCPELVQRASELERPGRLVAFPLEIDSAIEETAETGREFERRPDDVGPDASGGTLDLPDE